MKLRGCKEPVKEAWVKIPSSKEKANGGQAVILKQVVVGDPRVCQLEAGGYVDHTASSQR